MSVMSRLFALCLKGRTRSVRVNRHDRASGRKGARGSPPAKYC